MSEPEERDRPDGGETVESTHDESHNLETSDLSGTGVGLTVGEPNTFEPEEAGPDRGSPPE
jgi:hypothetical protein